MHIEAVVHLVGTAMSQRCKFRDQSKDEGSRTADQPRAPRFTNAQVLHTEGFGYQGGSRKRGNSRLGEGKGLWEPARANSTTEDRMDSG